MMWITSNENITGLIGGEGCSKSQKTLKEIDSNSIMDQEVAIVS